MTARRWIAAEMQTILVMWKAKRSASEIGIRFNVSRNTVIGRIHRWQIKQGLRQQYVSERPGYRQPKRRHPKQPSPPQTPRQLIDGKWTFRVIPARSMPPEPPSPALIEGQPITVLHLSNQRCKWPIGHSKRHGHHFCGQPPQDKSPYCEFHRLKGTIATSGIVRSGS